MAQLINLKLSRHDQSSPWGFRLQGGKDFGTPLLIQKVNFGSLAEKSGLQVGDALVRVNNQDVYDVKHKDAQDVILGAGNAFEVTIQRGGTSTWKPSVTPVGPSPVPSRLSQSPQILTKTSLAKVGPQSPAFGSSHNSVSRPYSGTSSPKVNPSGYNNDSGTVKAIVNKQYNTPVGIYSEENIAETLTAQAEVLAGGVLGVNFKKNEKNYEANNSEVLRMVQEADKEPRDLNTEVNQHVVVDTMNKIATRHVSAPEPKAPQSVPNQNICADCERLIVGVFVRIKDKSLHVECFKCATCGSSLKNVGYFNINNKLYCDIHAKMVARQNPPTPNLEPVTVAPGSNPPLGSFNIIPTKPKDVQSVQSPQPSTLSPIPFHAPKAPSHVNAPKQQTPSKVFSNAKPYEAPKQTPTPPMFSGGYSQVQTGFNSQLKTKSITSGGQPTGRTGASAGLTAPRRGRGVLNPQNLTPGARVPLCGQCNLYIRGPFITALGKIWCPEHFVCTNEKCRRPLQDIGFVEEDNGLYCEYCFEQYLAPVCSKCSKKIKGDCLNAIGKQFHPECFNCTYCGKLFGNSPFFLEDSLPYCENDWNELFTTKCIACGFPIEAGDRWVEALNSNYHSPCFNCSKCKVNLEGQSFYAKGGRPYCKSHAR
ncbi:PDZ and LIM domain protein Zasp isoform X5 [Acyrthosiphon pisum]|uniref:PDZ and LIM domain protein Zasp n=1 Tax=Acyrthosiphon pisum TaxID=7029 RepID=A0A8R2A6S1_ACYPI|nr:PDZ and LIM domain protein Zasp isoform X5 [Acyrthosiphon pisum]|eukprot:XP_003247586.1 PREDICTED: PDZ and LIM domain protein Zasp isoform X1 [Acyrthosiphon pisum]